ncbi:DUF4286 family protein [Sediminibacterium ginsengisoli]|uniref:DUF4286 domain-containing protein n=1 Tax=Sediminibacterium ginsengisoli TaxID=413434 RepID=A0A1T4JQD1_9BACT|nr:DUF4286 family protein [Sediminibacterium ginsengisoli]SJZ32364.1 protein of unknown function [Sediminibacterium ginsengisoli]
MLIYNTTIKVSWAIHDAWLQWVKAEHIPQMMRCGSFTGYRFVQLLDTDEEEGPTYAIQYELPDRQAYEHYQAQFAAGFRNEAFARWGNGFIGFHSLMQVVN